jgi:transcriptional regulator with XRE-family HTH domain
VDIKDFVNMTQRELGDITQIAPERWSRYFNERSAIAEGTLNKAAKALDLEPHELLMFINLRRDYGEAKK